MNNPFDYIPDEACRTAFSELVLMLNAIEDANLIRELEAGKMLGVLLASDAKGRIHTLYAFSGQLGNYGFYYPGFVGPVFDYLKPDGYFKRQEANILQQSNEIHRFEEETLSKAKKEFQEEEERLIYEVEAYRNQCHLSRLNRKRIRASGDIDEAQQLAMIQQSQFEKAELHRKKKSISDKLAPLREKMDNALKTLEAMKEKRRKDSEDLQHWLFDNFKLLNARGTQKSLTEIFANTSMKIPPSGAGECCAPKLLQTAYLQRLLPLSIAEYWYGKSKNGEIRLHGKHYPACRGKCLPVLGWMMQGLDIHPPFNCEQSVTGIFKPTILFENEWFCVINKPSGMLSVPGKGYAMSVQKWLEEKYGLECNVKLVHRLDQDTSGLLIAAFGDISYKLLQKQFALRKMRKTYIAELDGDYIEKNIPKRGRISLPLSHNWIDRPRQRIDFEMGKEAITDYEFVNVAKGFSRVKFYPLTGRTHQLRVHSASEYGLGMPIVGDRLYGEAGKKGALRLHAQKIEFTFPLNGHNYSFESPVPF